MRVTPASREESACTGSEYWPAPEPGEIDERGEIVGGDAAERVAVAAQR